MSLHLIGRSHSAHTAEAAPTREVSIHVCGGYQPDTIHAEAGVPLRLIFHREESSPCSEEVIFPALGKSAMLPRGERVAVELFPEEPGEYAFTCAMGMLRGTLVVGPRAELAS